MNKKTIIIIVSTVASQVIAVVAILMCMKYGFGTNATINEASAVDFSYRILLISGLVGMILSFMGCFYTAGLQMKTISKILLLLFFVCNQLLSVAWFYSWLLLTARL